MELQSYEIGRVPRTLVGVDALAQLPSAVESLGHMSVVLIVDAVVATGGYLDRVLQSLGSISTVVHIAPPGEPTVGSVDAAAAVVRAAPNSTVIGIGGGSALDIAKQAATVGTGDTGVEPYLLCATPLPGRRPIIAIPTTSGTGAEVTRTCIVSDREGRKMWTWGDEMLPDIVVLDPTAAATMPHAVTVGTGLDAFVHALEACTGTRRSSVATASAQRALRLVVDHLPRAAADGTDLAARQAMQEAAFLAGMAIDNCGTGVAHSIGHALGSLYHVPHGVSVAVGLHAALNWNVDGSPDAFDDAAAALGCSVDGVPDTLAALFAQTDMAAVVRNLGSGGFDPAAVAETMAAPENQPMLNNNARPIDDDARAMLAGRTVAVWDQLVAGSAV
ncbi:MAG: adh [Ilumatobacteraceae bacterium]|nr:adh [Ilumatobacteraceae bacterium]